MALRLKEAVTIALWLLLSAAVVFTCFGCTWSIGVDSVGLHGHLKVDEDLKRPAFDWIVDLTKDKEPGDAKDSADDLVTDGSEPIHVE